MVGYGSCRGSYAPLVNARGAPCRPGNRQPARPDSTHGTCATRYRCVAPPTSSRRKSWQLCQTARCMSGTFAAWTMRRQVDGGADPRRAAGVGVRLGLPAGQRFGGVVATAHTFRRRWCRAACRMSRGTALRSTAARASFGTLEKEPASRSLHASTEAARRMRVRQRSSTGPGLPCCRSAGRTPTSAARQHLAQRRLAGRVSAGRLVARTTAAATRRRAHDQPGAVPSMYVTTPSEPSIFEYSSAGSRSTVAVYAATIRPAHEGPRHHGMGPTRRSYEYRARQSPGTSTSGTTSESLSRASAVEPWPSLWAEAPQRCRMPMPMSMAVV